MKPGKVATIRLRPEDCMSIVDILELAKINTNGMTFAAACSAAVGVAMATLRDNGVLPTRQGFEYTDMMSRFIDRPKTRALKLSPGFSELAVEGLPASGARFNGPGAMDPKKQTRGELRQAQLRLQELEVKREHAGDSWSDEDQEEYDRLNRVVFTEQ